MEEEEEEEGEEEGEEEEERKMPLFKQGNSFSKVIKITVTNRSPGICFKTIIITEKKGKYTYKYGA